MTCRHTGGWRWLSVTCLVLLLQSLAAQDKPQVLTPPPPEQTPQQTAADPSISFEPIHTLHVYMDLIQVPVLVLDSEMERMKPIDPAKFVVSLDSGPTFRPRRVRQQGDDPITLGILLDLNGSPEQINKIGEAIAGLAPNSLHPKDHVSLLAVDCSLVRTLKDAPADPAMLRDGVNRALAGWQARRNEKRVAPCEKRVQLWDAMAFTVQMLSSLPGRRVLLAVTDGTDHGSTVKWNDLRQLAQRAGVAVFGYRSGPNAISNNAISGPGRGRGGSRGAANMGAAQVEADAFGAICQLSGGMVMPADPDYAAKRLVNLINMLRERYILEFARPRIEEAGEHSIDITISRGPPLLYIRPAGVSIVVRNAAIENDPSTIPRDATDAPEMGKRKVLKPATP